MSIFFKTTREGRSPHLCAFLMFTKTFDCVRSLSFKPVWASFQRAFKNNDTEEQPKFMRNIIDFEGNGLAITKSFCLSALLAPILAKKANSLISIK